METVLAQSPYPGPEWKVELVPANHDFGQLWKWKTILERFALSHANTIGITFVQIETNLNIAYTAPIIPPLWVGGIRPVDYGSTVFDTDWHALRNILVIATSDSYRTADALPHLLPLLGIPTDAVGLILYHDRFPSRIFTTEEEPDIPRDSQSIANETNQSPNGQTTGVEHSNNIETSSPTPSIEEQPAPATQQLNQETDNRPVPQHSITETTPSDPTTKPLQESPSDIRPPSGVTEKGRSTQNPLAAVQPPDKIAATIPPQSGTAEEGQPDGQETGNSPAPSETGNSQWTVIAIAVLVPFPLEYALYQIPVSPARRSRASWNPQLEVTFQYRQDYLEPVLAGIIALGIVTFLGLRHAARRAST